MKVFSNRAQNNFGNVVQMINNCILLATLSLIKVLETITRVMCFDFTVYGKHFLLSMKECMIVCCPQRLDEMRQGGKKNVNFFFFKKY